MEKQILISVGTTKFEKLIKAIDTKDFYNICYKYNYKKIIIQKGYGEYIPKNYIEYKDKLNIEIHTIIQNFENIIQNSDIIICHAGAGSILEGLKNKKKLIVCVNDTLMDNHQKELATSLNDENYIKYCENLNEIHIILEKIINDQIIIKPYPEFNYDIVPNLIYDILEI